MRQRFEMWRVASLAALATALILTVCSCGSPQEVPPNDEKPVEGQQSELPEISTLPEEEQEAAEMMQQMGLATRDGVQRIWAIIQVDGNAEKCFDDMYGTLIDGGEAVAGTISGVEIPEALVEVKAAMLQLGGDEHPLQSAWELMKKEIFEYQFAQEHSLLPSKAEVDEFAETMRGYLGDGSDSPAELYLYDGMGLTREQYWEVYKPAIEIQVQLVKDKIAKYCDENELSWNGIMEQAEIPAEMNSQRLTEMFGQ